MSRLEELKSSKMKELVLKKRTELEEICRKTHMVIEADSAIEYAIEAIESGVFQIIDNTSYVKENNYECVSECLHHSCLYRSCGPFMCIGPN